MAKKEKKDEKELYMQIQMMEAQMNGLRDQMEGIDQKINEVQELKKSIVDFKDLKGDEEIYLPVASGIFAKGKLLDSKTLKVNVGSGIVVDKSVDETQKIVETQIVELKKIKEQANNQLNELTEQASKLAESIGNV